MNTLISQTKAITDPVLAGVHEDEEKNNIPRLILNHGGIETEEEGARGTRVETVIEMTRRIDGTRNVEGKERELDLSHGDGTINISRRIDPLDTGALEVPKQDHLGLNRVISVDLTRKDMGTRGRVRANHHQGPGQNHDIAQKRKSMKYRGDEGEMIIDRGLDQNQGTVVTTMYTQIMTVGGCEMRRVQDPGHGTEMEMNKLAIVAGLSRVIGRNLDIEMKRTR